MENSFERKTSQVKQREQEKAGSSGHVIVEFYVKSVCSRLRAALMQLYKSALLKKCHFLSSFPLWLGMLSPQSGLHSFLSTPLLTMCLLVCQAGDLGASLTQMAWPFLFIHAMFSRQQQRFIACLSWRVFFQILIKISLSFKELECIRD